ncbi:MAG: ammonia-forming cytochrome c nitrite reductase subunit c552 [Candidatus Methanoperedens sp.]
MVKKRLILGIGILIILLALAGTVSAKTGYSTVAADCGYCHVSIVSGDYTLTTDGNYFKDVHKFNGKTVPANASSCLTCHTDMTSFLPLKPVGESYSETHRYNATTLAAKILPEPGCANCHVNAIANNFNLLTGTPTYLKSTTCVNCHKEKYDEWKGTNHANKLQTNTSAQAMNLPLPAGSSWANFSYVVIGLSKMYYFNESGYRTKGYNATSQSFENIASPGKYSCGSCHTTGYNASGNQGGLSGIVGTWKEAGIACERCHGAGGNGHQVEANVSSGVCTQCHSQANAKAWSSSGHAPPLKASASCTQCHSPFDYAKNKTVTSTSAANVVCATCHNSHDVTPDGYRSLYSTGGFNATTMAELANEEKAKLSFFNSTASKAAGESKYDELTTPSLIYNRDSSYPGPINVTGPISEVLCSKCHYYHGLGHIGQVNLTHGKAYGVNRATCVDCHMSTSQGNHSFNVMDKNNFPSQTCSRGTQCHVTSAQNLNKSKYSVVPVVNEWKASAHNDKEVGVSKNPNSSFYRSINGTTGIVTINSRQNSCMKCHSPSNWNPVTDSNTTNVKLDDSFNGITCAVCHNLHDMGDSLAKSKAAFGEAKGYAWYNRDAIPIYNAGVLVRYKANYTLMESTTELCGNCHSNIRYGNTGPGWQTPSSRNDYTGMIYPHGFPAKDIFVGSWKESGLLKFECKDCHMATKITASNGSLLPDSQKVKGHSFKVKPDLLQENTACSSCHVTGIEPGNLTTTIEDIQADTRAKWKTTKATVLSAFAIVNASTGEKTLSRDQISQAYWNVRLVDTDESWGVHNPAKVDQLLDEAATLAAASIESLGQVGTSSVQLYAGWNLVSLSATPASTSPVSVMSSVSSSLTVVWGLDAPTQTWVLYDPARPVGLNTLTKMVKGESYEIKVTKNSVWTV